MSTLVFSHGFGVKADSHGMFTEIADSFPDFNAILFDYNRISDNGDIEVVPLNEQASILQRKLDEQSGDVILIAHSQGCIVSGMVNLNNVKKVILLAPPVEKRRQWLIDTLVEKLGVEINQEGVSKLNRRGGRVTYIPKEYLDSVSGVDPINLYTKIASQVDTVIIRCTNDEVLGLTNVDEVPHAKHIDVVSDHNFTGEGRSKLISVLSEELSTFKDR